MKDVETLSTVLDAIKFKEKTTEEDLQAVVAERRYSNAAGFWHIGTGLMVARTIVETAIRNNKQGKK